MRHSSNRLQHIAIGAVALFGLLAYTLYSYARPLTLRQAQPRSVQDVIDLYGAAAEQRLQPFFEAAKAPYPPSRITLLAIKDENKLELWTQENGGAFFIRAYPIKAASGKRGPKLREGDQQVPEGIYTLEYLNPNSQFHLSMKINYPNEFDRTVAKEEKRTNLGGDIFIHGKAVSIGCLAMGDPAIEELFTLVVKSGRKNVVVVIAPSDPRKSDLASLAQKQPAWVAGLYTEISAAFSPYQTSFMQCH